MKRAGLLYLLLLMILPVLGAVAGRAAGPWMARMDYTVQVAERIHLEDSQRLPERTLQSEAFRASGAPEQKLFAQALAIQRRFDVAGLWFGLFIGLVAALKIIRLTREPERLEYEADPARCVACGRCYASCPLEQERLKETGEAAS